MDLHSFMTLSEQELEEVGVTIVEDRKALLLLIKSLKTNKSTPAANLLVSLNIHHAIYIVLLYLPLATARS